MIQTFADKRAAAIFVGKRVRSLPHDIQNRAREKLKMLSAAHMIDDLRVPPGNMLEALSGNRGGQWSIRINKQWSICFRWEEGDCFDVEIVDYHQEVKMSIKIDELSKIDFSDISDGEIQDVKPGDVLLHQFMEPFELSANSLAKAINVPTNRITSIINGTRGISVSTALRFAQAFGTSPEFWINLQVQYELEKTRTGEANDIIRIRRIAARNKNLTPNPLEKQSPFE